ncbi:MAG: helix-turn-helix domain-containing protein [Spirochaetes bacterium]|jgi:predicted RNase H-like HicB family nuclease|nr:helix-turn-helix domain-containing protein [Spirochaetota bacterium]
MTYRFAVSEEDDGYSAWCPELEGCRTQADGIAGLQQNAAEALDLYLDEAPSSSVLPPLPGAACSAHNDVANDISAADTDADWFMDVPVAPGRALALQLKHHRAANRLSQTEMAARLGMKNVYSYQRLERNANPRLSTLTRLKRMVPSLALDEITDSPQAPRPLGGDRNHMSAAALTSPGQ